MIFESIAALIADRLECDPADITMDSKFHDLGIDSLDTVELLMQLEDEIGMEVELDQKVETVGELVAFIETKKAEQEG
ncbi:MAG: acyl carrier protein [Oscillospiraceae bacterium]|nr:acyl carrier protein [Oscillospiraceae bacterium]MCD8115854.1 acyl carrier protein [Oscillospiraceae bacterium]